MLSSGNKGLPQDATWLQKNNFRLFEVYPHEIHSFMCMRVLMFCVLFSYTSLRIIKDSLILEYAGAESVNVLMTSIALPLAWICTFLYERAANRIADFESVDARLRGMKHLYYRAMVPIFCFFLFFGAVLYPYRATIHGGKPWAEAVKSGTGIIFERFVTGLLLKAVVALVIGYTSATFLRFLGIRIPALVCGLVTLVQLALVYPLLYPDQRGLIAYASVLVRNPMLASGLLHPSISLMGAWAFAIYYAVSEVFGHVAVPMLFWQFANQITAREEADRFYPAYAIIANVALIIAGVLMMTSSDRWGGFDTKVVCFLAMISTVIAINMLVYNHMFTRSIDRI